MTRTILACLAAAAMSGAALADEPIDIAPIAFGDELLEKADEYGERELERLAGYLTQDLEQALRGIEMADGTRLEVTLLDAEPNRPTFQQLRDRVGLSSQSISLGGADLEAVLVSADGSVIEDFEYSWSSSSLREVYGASTWYDARKAFDRFSRRVRGDVHDHLRAGS
ncbi:hypothetical protein [Maricaulis sp.]|uniref:hypothetical protein n=1 Tax=Maricaulis sp. TaxID=1486257 RepID=UPI00260E45E8|nr:hypothetical protein [Maricaulis sp.]